MISENTDGTHRGEYGGETEGDSNQEQRIHKSGTHCGNSFGKDADWSKLNVTSIQDNRKTLSSCGQKRRELGPTAWSRHLLREKEKCHEGHYWVT